MAEKILERKKQETGLRDIYTVLFRHRTKVLLFLSVVMIVTLLSTFFASETYQSNAKLMVRLGRESITLDPTVTTGQIAHVGQNRESEINSEIEILRSREIAENVVDALGAETILFGRRQGVASETEDTFLANLRRKVKALKRLPSTLVSYLFDSSQAPDPLEEAKKRAQAVNALMSNLDIQAIDKSNILSISYEARTPQAGHEVMQKLIDVYLDKHISVYRTAGSYGFFKEQAEELQESLAETEEELRNLKNTTGTASLEEQQRILLERIGALQRETEGITAAKAAAEARVKALQKTLAAVPKTVQTQEITGFANSAADEMWKRINELRLKEQDLLSTFTENSVPVQEIRRQIKGAQGMLSNLQEARQVTKGVNTTYQQLELDLWKEEGNLASAQAQAVALRTQLANADRELKALNDNEVRLAQLQRELDIQLTSYRKYSESLEQARIDQALEIQKISNISVVQPASYPVEPLRSRTMMNLMLGLFIGTFGGIALAFFFEYLDHTFKRPEDIEERLHLPALGFLPLLASNGAMLKERTTQMARLLGVQASEANTLPFPTSTIPVGTVESYEAAGQALLKSSAETQARIFAVTSCRTGEGVSTVATQLAVTLAQHCQGRVLLIDANTRKASVHQTFGMKPAPGLAGIVASNNGHIPSVGASSIKNLDLLCSGQEPCDLTGLSDSQSFNNFLNLWRSEYKFIVFDGPAIEDGNQAVAMTKFADGVILVLEAERVRWEVARRSVERLRQAQTNILGVILNKRRFYIPEWLYRTL